MILTATPVIPGLSADHQATMAKLVNQIQLKAPRNRLRLRYYDYKQGLKDLGISLPPQMKRVDTVLGWPAKAVDSMVNRTILDTWNLPDGLTADEIGLSALYESNRLDTEIPAGLTTTLVHSVAFGFVNAGDPSMGEPEAMLLIRSPEWASGTWDTRRRCITEALSILSVDDWGMPDRMNLYLPNVVIIMRRDGYRWDLSQVTHDLGVPVEPIPYRPLPPTRPFGYSRISRPIMSLTDSAIRTFVRTEVSAEFYNSPQRYALGVDDDTFTDKATGEKIPGWKIILGHLLELSRDENGNVPEVGQFTQQSMQPNEGHFRMIAQAFSAETNLPLRSLGVVGDNPESAESQRQAEREFALQITNWQQTALTPAFKRLATYALRIRDDSPAARSVYRRMLPHWKRPDTVSPAEAADAVVKLGSAIPGFGASEVGLELAGLEPEQISRFQAEQRRQQSRANIAALTGATDGTAGTPPVSEAVNEAQDIKAKADAMGVLIRAGVDPDDAARRVGLPGVQFRQGVMPASLVARDADAG